MYNIQHTQSSDLQFRQQHIKFVHSQLDEQFYWGQPCGRAFTLSMNVQLKLVVLMSLSPYETHASSQNSLSSSQSHALLMIRPERDTETHTTFPSVTTGCLCVWMYVWVSVCVCVCVYHLTFECDLGSAPLLDLQSALLTCRHTPQAGEQLMFP